jgi:hypothetical protein
MATSPRSNPRPPERGANAASTHNHYAQEAQGPAHVDLLGLVATAEEVSRRYQTQVLQRWLGRAYRAWNNEHAHGSKYLGSAWRGRSRLFVPKTRASVRKNLAAAAAALFSTDDVVNVTAEHEDNDIDRATAAVLKADLDYRLTRTNSVSGMPWFMICMGGCLDAQLTGVTISKQYWEYREVDTGHDDQHVVLVQNPLTGEPELQRIEKPRMRVVCDRPMVELVPIENVGIDPAAPWYDPVQLGAWFYADYPMHLSDVRAMIGSPDKSGANSWISVDDATLMKGRLRDEAMANRRAREGGSDRYDDMGTSGEFDIVVIRENFLRVEGRDYHFWSVGSHAYLSIVRETADVYPELGGTRPYTFGVAGIDTHRVFPMPPVESWQPLQLELNDIANLRLDTLKRSIAPLPVVRRGRNIDLSQLQRRGQPDAVLLADDPSDINFVASPTPPGAAYTESAIANSLFDELSGAFSTSSVQSNRQLNETVGGMRLLAGASNSVTEFDLRVWIETWVEPTLRQLLHLVRARETDDTLIRLAGQKARALQRFNYMPTQEDFAAVEVALRVNVGIGAADPMQKLSKFRAAMEMLSPLMPIMSAQGIKLNVEQIIDEVMGMAGFRDGRRFFEFGAPSDDAGAPPPELAKLMEEAKLERERLAWERERFGLELRAKEAEAKLNNATKLQIEAMRGRAAIAREAIEGHADVAVAKIRAETHDRPIADDAGAPTQAPELSDLQGRVIESPPVETAPEPIWQQPTGNAETAGASSGEPHATGLIDGAIITQLRQLHDLIAQIGGMVHDLDQKINAPAEIVRDPQSGRPIGVRKAGQLQLVERNAHGTIIGLRPIASVASVQDNVMPQTDNSGIGP